MTLLQRIGLVFIAMTLSGIFGAFTGYRYAKGQEATVKVEKLETQITVINDQVKQDTQLIATQVTRRVKQNQEVKQIETQGVMDAALKTNRSCGWDDESYGLLIRAIDTANGTGSHSRVPAGLSPSALSGGSNGSGLTRLDVPGNQQRQ